MSIPCSKVLRPWPSCPVDFFVSLSGVSPELCANQTNRRSSSFLLANKWKRLPNFSSPQQRHFSPTTSMIRTRITMDLTKTKACQEVIGYRFCDPTLLWEALQAKGSYTCAMLEEQATNSRYKAGNRRLAMVGDEVMNVLLSEE